MVSPSPMPPSDGRPCVNGSNTDGSSPGEMPSPRSATAMTTGRPERRAQLVGHGGEQAILERARPLRRRAGRALALDLPLQPVDGREVVAPSGDHRKVLLQPDGASAVNTKFQRTFGCVLLSTQKIGE